MSDIRIHIDEGLADSISKSLNLTRSELQDVLPITVRLLGEFREGASLNDVLGGIVEAIANLEVAAKQ